MNQQRLLRVAAFCFLALAFSCKEELLTTENPSEMNIIQEGSVKNGRLYFPNQESFTYAYDKIKNAEDEVIADYIDKQGIISLRPVVTEQNEQKIYEKTLQRVELLRQNKRYLAHQALMGKGDIPPDTELENVIDDIDDLEEIIGDDAFAAFLNEGAEVQIGNKIYKYTDAGLFITTVPNYDNLIVYLEGQNISDNLLYPTDPTVAENYVANHATGEVVPVTEDIDYFGKIPPQDCGGEPCNGDSGGGPQPPEPTGSDWGNFVDGLPFCDTYNTWLQSLFGDHDMCVDKYDSDLRVKAKAYNANYIIAYVTGVKVKHQKKGWTGLWRKEAADHVRLGVLGACYYYDYSSFLNQNGRKTNIYTRNKLVDFNNSTFFWEADPFNPGMYTITGFSTADFPEIFKDDYLIQDIVPFDLSVNNETLDGLLYAAVKAGNKNLTADRLNELVWQKVISQLGKWTTSTPEEEEPDDKKPMDKITYAINMLKEGKLLVHKTLYEQESNVASVQKTFDWGVGTIGFTIGTNGQIVPSMSPSALRKPQDLKVIMYGVVKKNGSWHGIKMKNW
ncbi:MAG: hypothetical protein LBE36_05265 [Flavobacteriaceae bacterium]|jgi:hypothetical protein|nr:hypothetical protein [Flavobacteriaceae bacterium]